MADNHRTLYDTYIDYDHVDLDITAVADHVAMQQIAGENFEMEKRTLEDVLSDRTFNVPEYQRLFSWKEKHHRQLWSDLQQFVEADLVEDSDVSDVFFSSMYFAVDKDSNTHEIIDGQQRLTSINILLLSILEELRALKAESIQQDTVSQLREGSIKQIESLLYRFENPLKGDIPRLSLNKHDDDDDADLGFFEALMLGPETRLEYLCSDEREHVDGRRGDATRISDLIKEFRISDQVIEEKDPDTSFSYFTPVYDSNWRLLDAYNFYKERIKEVIDGADDTDSEALALINLSHYIQNSYHVGEFIVRNAAPDFRMQIFEILNDRGLELTKIDRIRAAVVNAFFDADDRQEYVDKWEDIVVAFATDEDQIDDYLSVYLSIIDPEIETVGEASAELTNAFATRNLESDVRPRLRHLDDARGFLDHAHEFVQYYKDITNSALEPTDLALAEAHEKCQEVLVRLNDQQMNQWRPFILALYHHTVRDSDASGEQLYDVLDTVEKLNFRRLLVGEDPNIFQEIFIETVHRFSLSPEMEDRENVYDDSCLHLIDEMRSSNPSMFSDRFVDIVTQAQAWNPQNAKLLFGKIANEHFREDGMYVERRLNMGSIHLEHVLPQSLIHDANDPVWLTEFFQLEDDDEVEIEDAIQTYVELYRRDDSELSEDERQRRDNIAEFITQRFVNDLGNFLLLRDSDNIKASNLPLAEKMPQYFDTGEDFRSIHPNRYFTGTEGVVDRRKLEDLLEQSRAVQQGERDEIDPALANYFNSLWTYEALQNRRVGLLEDTLDIVEFEQLDDEFGLTSDRDGIREQIRSQTEQEFEKRLSLRSL
ncbi:GmrSD restriction endonuclease domain-containing protein [Halomicrococcus sp. NG-SE-24]|uniref:GmrSD restriction endonuclease domain-containing protein n=1 Tax=Halomicrococcus sp. NG-SE-24 TaxID=3436928 RepID=UPI003D9783FB